MSSSDQRPSFDTYFMQLAVHASTRATCDRGHVGAVLVRDNVVLATGYNGSAPGLSHCDDVGHMMEDGHCVRTIHAETNALYSAARHGGDLSKGFTCYTTASPCWRCFQALLRSGCTRIVYRTFYRDERIFEAAQEAGIELMKLEIPLQS